MSENQATHAQTARPSHARRSSKMQRRTRRTQSPRVQARPLEDVIIELLATPRYAGDDICALQLAFGKWPHRADPEGVTRALVLAQSCGLILRPCYENMLCGRELYFNAEDLGCEQPEFGREQREFLLRSVARWLLTRAGLSETRSSVERVSQVLFDLYRRQGEGLLPLNLRPETKELARREKERKELRMSRGKTA